MSSRARFDSARFVVSWSAGLDHVKYQTGTRLVLTETRDTNMGYPTFSDRHEGVPKGYQMGSRYGPKSEKGSISATKHLSLGLYRRKPPCPSTRRKSFSRVSFRNSLVNVGGRNRGWGIRIPYGRVRYGILLQHTTACVHHAIFSPTLVWGLIARIREVQGVPRRTGIIPVLASAGDAAGIFG